jgi:hypothetical protein
VVEKPKKNTEDDAPQVDAGWDDWEEPDDDSHSERPTVAPPFDLASYAKEKAADDATTDKFPSDTAITLPPPALPATPPPATAGTPAIAPPSEPFSQRKTPPAIAKPDAARRPRRATPQPSSQSLLALVNRNAPSAPPAARRIETPRMGSQGIGARGIEAPGVDEGTALELVAKQADPTPPSTDPVGEMHERFALGDYSGALVVAESLLEENPSHAEANEYAESCRGVLAQMYTARIGPLDRVPFVEVQRDQLRWLSLDHRAGFVLSLVDGVSSLEMILDVSGMATLDALRILYELVEQRIISLR